MFWGVNCVVQAECWLISTEAIRTIRDGEPKADTLTFIQVLSSENIKKNYLKKQQKTHQQQTHPNNNYV